MECMSTCKVFLSKHYIYINLQLNSINKVTEGFIESTLY